MVAVTITAIKLAGTAGERGKTSGAVHAAGVPEAQDNDNWIWVPRVGCDPRDIQQIRLPSRA
jgi:hypothetical protein